MRFPKSLSAFPCAIALTLLISCASGAAGPNNAKQNKMASLDAFLKIHRVKTNLPAVAAAVVRDGTIVAAGVAGIRHAGSTQKVTLADKWHIGSCTKSMTATLAAILVEEGTLRWRMPLSEAFPKLAPKMRQGWRSATIEQLLAHRGGGPPGVMGNWLWARLWLRATLPGREQRAYLTEELLTRQDPSYLPGTRYEYSNGGYALVGHLIEEKLNQPYEEVLRKRLFKPLKMTSAGFGTPATKQNPNQPWGHILRNGKAEAEPPGIKADNPAAIGPGGTVHCSIMDLARYAAFHVRGDRNGDALLSRKSFQKLHKPFAADGDYAMGWSTVERDWGGGAVLMHNGSNTMNYAVMWLAPRRNLAVVACTNADGDGVDMAIDDIVGQLILKYNVSKTAP